MSKTAVIYAYHQDNTSVKVFRKDGVIPHDDVDYFIVKNNPEWELGATPTINKDTTLEGSNSRYVEIERCNRSQDWGSYSEAIRQRNSDDYDNFVLLNSSMRGPFLPPWFKKSYKEGGDTFKGWHSTMPTDDVALTGASINTDMGPHVQSMMMAFDQRALKIFLEKEIIMSSNRQISKVDLIKNHGIGSSAAVLEAGFNIDCILSAVQGVDWRENPPKVKPYASKTCLWGTGRYYGGEIHPYESLFVKTNRDWEPRNMFEKITYWDDSGEESVFDVDEEEVEKKIFSKKDDESDIKKFFEPKMIALFAVSSIAVILSILLILSTLGKL